jgi:hypothetical protein
MPLPLTIEDRVRAEIQNLPPAVTALDHHLLALILFTKLERPDLYERVLKIVLEYN